MIPQQTVNASRTNHVSFDFCFPLCYLCCWNMAQSGGQNDTHLKYALEKSMHPTYFSSLRSALRWMYFQPLFCRSCNGKPWVWSSHKYSSRFKLRLDTSSLNNPVAVILKSFLLLPFSTSLDHKKLTFVFLCQRWKGNQQHPTFRFYSSRIWKSW